MAKYLRSPSYIRKPSLYMTLYPFHLNFLNFLIYKEIVVYFFLTVYKRGETGKKKWEGKEREERKVGGKR